MPNQNINAKCCSGHNFSRNVKIVSDRTTANISPQCAVVVERYMYS